MKRLLAFLMMASMVFTLTACGSKTAADQNAGDDQTASEPEKLMRMRKKTNRRTTALLRLKKQSSPIRHLQTVMIS